jgi:TRAP-type uncharacterized transport system fused permease subunit
MQDKPSEPMHVDEATKRFQSFSTPVKFFFLALTTCGIGIAVIYIFGLVPVLDVTYYFLLMAMFIPLVFLLLPARKNETKVAWYSYVLAIVAFGIFTFLSTKGYQLMYTVFIPPNQWQFIVAVVVFLLILEAARRLGGLIFLGVVTVLSLYPIVAHKMPGLLWGPPSPFSRTVAFNVYSNDAMLGMVTRVVGETLIGFLLLASF